MVPARAARPPSVGPVVDTYSLYYSRDMCGVRLQADQPRRLPRRKQAGYAAGATVSRQTTDYEGPAEAGHYVRRLETDRLEHALVERAAGHGAECFPVLARMRGRGVRV